MKRTRAASINLLVVLLIVALITGTKIQKISFPIKKHQKKEKKAAKCLLFQEKAVPLHHQNKTSRSGAVVARWAHNPKVIGSNPFSATTRLKHMLKSFSISI